MGGLKPKIEDGIRMFKPTNLKDATSLARMRDEQLNRLSPITQASVGPTKNTTMKHLTEDEMQKKRAQALSWDLSIGTRAMASNKDRIENLEVALEKLQDGIVEINISFADKYQHLEDIMMKLSDAVLSRKGSDNYKQAGMLMFYLKLTKLEFPTYRGDENPTEWFTKVDQFFENQGTPVTQKVSLASYHLQGEANIWWRWLRKAYQEKLKEVTWDIFFEELWSWFGPTDCEDFDEALLKTQKALVGTFMGGLKLEIADGIRMFKSINLKDATSLARMRDEQLNRLSPITQASSAGPTKNTTMKRLTWDDIQKRRAQALSWDLSIGTRAMASNKDQIENLEVALGQLQDGIAEMKISFADKFQHLEDIVMKLFGKGGDNYKQAGRLMFYSKLT
ncbi:hypothetical protein Tco_0845652 [Tanacetum coccineum]